MKMKKLAVMLVAGLVMMCGYNPATKQGCTHVHDDHCGYQYGQCEHVYHQEAGISPAIDKGGEC